MRLWTRIVAVRVVAPIAFRHSLTLLGRMYLPTLSDL